MPVNSTGITALLEDVNQGRPGAWDRLMDAAYDELRAGADRLMRQNVRPGGPGGTLQPTALVHEAFLRLISEGLNFEKRGHFFVAFSTRMMHFLMDHIRSQKAKKRGGGWARVALDPDAGVPDGPATDDNPDRAGSDDGADILALVEVLEKLEALDARKADVVRLRLFCGLTVAQVGEALGVAKGTVERNWSFAKAWVANELGG